jgi:hypothetical protein
MTKNTVSNKIPKNRLHGSTYGKNPGRLAIANPD